MALSVIAYKCGVSYEELEADVYMIADMWRHTAQWDSPFNRSNVPAAMRCHSPKFSRVRRETLEEWLGWAFTGTTKRNGRTRQDHLGRVAIGKRIISVDKISKYLKENPNASRAQIAKALKMSRNTVAKYYEIAKK